MADRAFINPQVLRWARESARMTLEDSAKKVNVTPDKLEEWEAGVSQPTVRQAETLAHYYKRPFALLFLPDIPRDFTPLADFRRDTSREFSTGSIFIIRDIRQKQAWISELLQDDGAEPLSFVGAFTVRDHPERVANYILEVLNIDPSNYDGSPLQEWIAKAEAAGIFVPRTSFLHSRMKLDSDEFKGFAIADRYAPYVFVNSDDWDKPQLFTLVHEIAHIIIAETGISGDIDLAPEKQREANHPVEIFCNEVAAIALMPTAIMRSYGSRIFQSAPALFAAANKLGVSSFAFLVRALNMGLISFDQYRNLRRDADAEFQDYVRRYEAQRAAAKLEKKGGPNGNLLKTLRNGRLFTQLVLNAFYGGRIQPTEASSLLSTPVNKFPQLERFLFS